MRLSRAWTGGAPLADGVCLRRNPSSGATSYAESGDSGSRAFVLFESGLAADMCSLLQGIIDDNPSLGLTHHTEAETTYTKGVGSGDNTATATARGEAVGSGSVERKYDWSGVTENWPAESVIDHLLLVVHGIGTNDETLPSYVETLRQTFEPGWQRKYLDIPLAVAVDAISWHTMARAPQETMEKITLPTVPAIRSVMNDTILDVLYYRSPHYGQRLINAVAHLLNSKVALYRKRFPKFSGQVGTSSTFLPIRQSAAPLAQP